MADTLYASKALRLAAGLAISLAVLLLQWVVGQWLGSRIAFLFALPALIFTAFSLGRGPAVLVLLAGAAPAAFRLLALIDQPEAAIKDGAALCAYLVIGGLLVVFGNRLHLTTTRAALAEERLQLAQEDTNLGVYELNFETGLAVVSQGLCRLLEQPVQHGPIPLEKWFAMLPSETVSETQRVLQEKVDAGDLRYEREQRIEFASGHVKWLLARVRLSVSASGQLLSAHGATIDITERKKTDELLQQTQAELRQQLDDVRRLQAFSQSLVSAGSDIDDALARLLRLLCDFHGAPRGLIVLNGEAGGEAGGAPRLAAQVGLAGAALTRVQAWLQSQAGDAAGSARVMLAAGGDDPAAGPAATSPEAALAAACAAQALHATALRDGAGQVIGLLLVLFEQPHTTQEREIALSDICAGTASAIIERDRARRVAAVNEQRFAVALQSSTVPFTILAPVRDAQQRIFDFRWTYANPAAARVLGYASDQLVGQRVNALLPGSWDGRDMLSLYAAAVEQGIPCEFELQDRAAPDTWFHVIGSPLQESVAVWFADISARKQHQRDLQTADRRKDEFLATLAHELRNPLAPVLQAVKLARDPAMQAERRIWSLDIIERQVQRMAQLLDDLLDVSRITRGAITLRRAPALLSELVAMAVEISAPLVETRQHHLSLDLPPQAVHLNVDVLRISQVLANLLTNAAKYTDPNGRIELQARVHQGQLRLQVADTGMGLSAEHLGQVFEMFSQAPDALVRSQGGLGIGLALSRGLVELHGGALIAESEGPGTGCRFIITLPADCVLEVSAPPEPPLPLPVQLPHSVAVSPVDPLSFLIADDNADAADTLAEILRMDGHQVQIAYDGQAAVAAFERGRFDVALLDIGMPKLSGHDAARAIRALPQGRDAVLIALTGFGQAQDRKNSLDAGFDHHATKPIFPDALLSMLAGGKRL